MEKKDYKLDMMFPVPPGTTFLNPTRADYSDYIAQTFILYLYSDERGQNQNHFTSQQRLFVNALLAAEPDAIELEDQPWNKSALRFYIEPQALHSMTRPTMDTAVYGKFNADYSREYTLTSALCPSIQYDDYIYVRSSAESAHWSVARNNKTDIIAILPRNKGYGQTTSLTQSSIADVRTNSINDTLESMRTMILRITDSEGNLLSFSTPYKLNILVFFQ